MPGRIGFVFQTTFSCAAAWIASYSFGATTPRKLFTCTTFAPGMCAIEVGSTLTGTFELYGYAPWPRGRTIRPCSIPGSRTFWT